MTSPKKVLKHRHLLAPEAAGEVAQLLRGRPGVELVVDQDLDVILFLFVSQTLGLLVATS